VCCVIGTGEVEADVGVDTGTLSVLPGSGVAVGGGSVDSSTKEKGVGVKEEAVG
jgi:hypothetical protein